MKLYILSFFLILATAFPALAASNDAPIEVTADKALEWDRAQSMFVAHGNAFAVQGDISIRSEELTAKYEDTDGGMTIQTITAKGATTLKNGDITGYGDGGFLNITENYAELTGKNPRIETKTDTLSATKKIKYSMIENKMEAIGGVVLKRPTETLSATNLTAFFKNSELDHALATGDITIKTENETLYGDKLDYNAVKHLAIVTGNVRIEQGKNILTGDRAEIDMNTHTSTLTATKSSGRVRAVFYPSKK